MRVLRRRAPSAVSRGVPGEGTRRAGCGVDAPDRSRKKTKTDTQTAVLRLGAAELAGSAAATLGNGDLVKPGCSLTPAGTSAPHGAACCEETWPRPSGRSQRVGGAASPRKSARGHRLLGTRGQ